MEQWHNAYIKYFDNLRGVGVVKVPELNQTFFIHYYSASENGTKRVDFERFDLIEVQIYYDSHFEQVDKCRKSDWIDVKDLLSDILIDFLEQTEAKEFSGFHHHILNNILCDINFIQK